MNNTEINNAIAELYRTANTLEELYIENEGEVTEDSAQLEEQLEAIKTLLNGDGIDSLGRWLKGKEDERATLKAEKAAIDRRIKATERTIDYIKFQVGEVLRATGCEKVKGLSYSFAQATSTKTSVNMDIIDNQFLDAATDAARDAGLPSFIDVALVTNVTKIKDFIENLPEGEDLEFDPFTYINETTTPTIRFTKPRVAKEKKDD